MGVGQSATAPQPQSNLPTASSTQQQATAAAGTDLFSDLIKQAHEADVTAAAATKAAMSPVAGARQLPQAVRSLGPQPHEMYGMDTQPVVGHHNAQMRGIVNLSKGVSNLVGQVTQAKTQQKTQRLAVNIERLMGAVNAADQAKQVLANEPGNTAANDQLKRATAIQDEILGDDKNRKDIEKAYNISFTDPSKNNTPEHAALKQATDSYAQQFQAKLPQQLQQDPYKVAQAQAAQAQAKATRETVNKILPAIYAFQARIGAAKIGAVAKLTAQQRHDQTMKEIEGSKEFAYLKGKNIQAWAIMGAAKLRSDALKYDSDQRLAGVRIKNDLKDPKTLKGITEAYNDLGNQMLKDQQVIQNATQQRKYPGVDTGTYDAQIRIAEEDLASLGPMKAKYAQRMAELAGIPKDQVTAALKKPDTPGAPQGQSGADITFKQAIGMLTQGLLGRPGADAGPTGSTSTDTIPPLTDTSGGLGQQPEANTPPTSNEDDTSAEDYRRLQEELGSENDSADSDDSWIYQ